MSQSMKVCTDIRSNRKVQVHSYHRMWHNIT